jgi:2-polyprenyl-3-methyl-5-hydroxy-6-metoxy-1,4-benzoquinol methylase
MPDLTTRQREPEWMDADDVDPTRLRQSLAFIRKVNRRLGYTRATLTHLERFSRNWKPGEPIRLIDFATGSADIPRAILAWADRKGFDVRIVAVDRHAETVRAARENASDPRLDIIQADVLNLPFDQREFDYALTAMFLHHLDDDDVVRVLATMSHVSKRGIIAADLLRHRRAYAWISLFTLRSNPMLKHDARVSVQQAFTREEILSLRDRAGVGFASYYPHFGHRFVLAGEKENPPQA